MRRGLHRFGRWAYESISHVLRPALRMDRMGWLRFLPSFPPRGRKTMPGRWPETMGWDAPARLRTVAGIWRDGSAEATAAEAEPLRDYSIVHRSATEDTFVHGWGFVLLTGGRVFRALRRMRRVRERNPGRGVDARAGTGSRGSDETRTTDLTERVEAVAARAGLNKVGFAPYDWKYSFVEHRAEHTDPTVIVCVVEQNYEATQTAPSIRAERGAFWAYGDLLRAMNAFAEEIHAMGWRARPQPIGAEMVTIHYAVQAGLGQLGLNGQLLTPEAGSRVRLGLITTDAPVAHGHPVDYGVHSICDECQVCVRRCPVGAIPARRDQHRGVTKAKIKTERCFPVVARTHGCAICMKVCPVQRYGLREVTEHYERTGSILGKDTDELEEFRWPLDAIVYGAGSKPRVGPDVVRPPGFSLDPVATAEAQPEASE